MLNMFLMSKIELEQHFKTIARHCFAFWRAGFSL
jgi:hypothetical protein